MHAPGIASQFDSASCTRHLSQGAQTLMPSMLLVVSAGALRELIPEVPPPPAPGIVYVPTESADPYLKWVIANAVEVEEHIIVAQHHGLRPQLSESDSGGARSSRDTEVDLSNLRRELSLPTHTSTNLRSLQTHT